MKKMLEKAKKILIWTWLGILGASGIIPAMLLLLENTFEYSEEFEEFYAQWFLLVFIPMLILTGMFMWAAEKADESRLKGWRWSYMAVGEFFAIIVKAVYYTLWFAWMVVWAPSRFLAVSAWSFCDRLRYNQAMNGFYLTPVPAVATASVAPKAASEVRYPIQECRIVSADPDPPPVPYQASAPAASAAKSAPVIAPPLKVDPPRAVPANIGTDISKMERIPPGEPLGKVYTLACGSGGCEAYRPKTKVSPPPPEKETEERESSLYSGIVGGNLRAARWVKLHGKGTLPNLSFQVDPNQGEYPCHHCLEPLITYSLGPEQWRVCPLCGRLVQDDLLRVHHLLLDGMQRVKLFFEDIHYYLYHENEHVLNFPWRVSGGDASELSRRNRKTHRKMKARFRVLQTACRYLRDFQWEKLGDDFDVDTVAQSLLERYPEKDGGLAELLGRHRWVHLEVGALLKKHAGAGEITGFQYKLISTPSRYILGGGYELRQMLKDRLRALGS